MEEAKKELLAIDPGDLATLDIRLVGPLAEKLMVRDKGIESSQDLRDRLLLMRMKMQGSGHKPYFQFSRVQAEAATKRRKCQEILQNITNIFRDVSKTEARSLWFEALSEILLQEKLLTKHNLMDELTDRMRALQAKLTLIIIAGETNSGKSTFLNVLLGEKVLPTDVLHCTYVVCKIIYSHSYIVETLDYEGHCEEFHCLNCDEAREKLKEVVTCANLQRRQQNSCFKEITLKMPAEILKSGITLVDTPGIGENEAMDGVTIDFVREAQASAFIYVIKSDDAGGVQEDRLLAFLRAVKENYKRDRLEGTFDPQAAMFVCHRWDTINPSEVEKVRKNALIKLEMVWPGFQPRQTFLFSSKKAQLHLDIDRDFIIESLNDLLNGLKQLIDRATHNAIKYQYCWIKIFLQPACRHLRSMILNCTMNKEDLDDKFRDVAEKQERLMEECKVQEPMYKKSLNDQKTYLREKIINILSLKDVKFSRDFDDYEALLAKCKEEKFLHSSENRRRLDHQIVTCLTKYCDEYLIRDDILKPIEDSILQEIKKQLGLVEHQIKQIKNDIQGTEMTRRRMSVVSSGSFTSSTSRFSLEGSYNSSISLSSDNDEGEVANIPDPSVLNHQVEHFLSRKNSRKAVTKFLKSGAKLGKRIMDQMASGGSTGSNPLQYLDDQIGKIAKAICEDSSLMDAFVSRYFHFSERCISHALKCVPHFIAVNTELMNKIRDHREAFLKDKQCMKEVMESLEPHRTQLQGYGVLYMEDVHADQINLNIDRRMSQVQLPQGLMVSTKPDDDSGFEGSGSTRTKARGFWTHMLNARMDVDETPMYVTLKTFSFVREDSAQYSEIAALRCLEHRTVASFFGMTRIQGQNAQRDESTPRPQIPAFIFKGVLWAANVYRKMKLLNVQEFVPTFLNELRQGLDFIHMEHLVHLELNLDTVMVDSQSGTVQLCQQCKPRVPQLPADLSCMTKSAVCLSPSALEGNVYQISDDIYAYGILVWELLYPQNLPYADQREWTLERFIEEVHPSKMLNPALESLDASPSVKKILNGCLICTKGTIITMKDIARELFRFREDIDRDPAIQALKNRCPRSGGCQGYEEPDESMTQATDRPNRRTSAVAESMNPKENTRSLGNCVTVPPRPPPRQKRRPTRHSVTVAPDLNKLLIPGHHRDRKMSLPNTPVMNSDEKCQLFGLVAPMPSAGNARMPLDYETASLKRKDKSAKGISLRNEMDENFPKENSFGFIPCLKVDQPSVQISDSDYDQRCGNHNSQSSQGKDPFSRARQSVDLSSVYKHYPNAQFANGATSSSHGSGRLPQLLKNYHSLDSTDGSVGSHGKEFSIQSQFVPHGDPINTEATHYFDKRRPLKQQRRITVLKFQPSLGKLDCSDSPEREGIQNTDGELPEEKIGHSLTSNSGTHASVWDQNYNNVDFSRVKIEADNNNSPETWMLEQATNDFSAVPVSNSKFPFSPRPTQLENATLNGNGPAEPMFKLGSSSSSFTDNNENIFSSSSADSQFSESTGSTYSSVSPFCPLLNSATPAFPPFGQRNLDVEESDTDTINIETENLPAIDRDDLSF